MTLTSNAALTAALRALRIIAELPPDVAKEEAAVLAIDTLKEVTGEQWEYNATLRRFAQVARQS